MGSTRNIAGRFAGVLLLTAAACSVMLTGCGGGSAGAMTAPAAPPASQTTGSDIPNYNPPSTWISMIEEAGFADYARLGSEMVASGRVKMVSPPELGENFNAFAYVDTKEIWINRPLFDRYPDVVDQATIFLHELIHIKSGELTHNGPWWSAQGEFHAYWTDRQSGASVASLLVSDANTGVAR